MSVLSVDLGTSNTVAVLSAHGRPPRVVDVDGSSTMPSAVFAAEDGNLVVGREAERRARLAPARYEPNPKRRIDEGSLLLGDSVVEVSAALAAVLGKVAAETTRQLNGARPDEVRLTHPAQWGPARRNILLTAARQAGLGSSLQLVPEPVAAAAHFASFTGRSVAPGQSLAVYDLGAGTFDVAVVGAGDQGFTVLAENGLPDLGGLDVDQAVLEHIGRSVSTQDPALWQQLLLPQSTADRRAARSLREDIRAAKEALSEHPQTEVPLPDPFGDVLLTRAELESLIRPGLLRSVEVLAATVRSAGTDPASLAGIYLVGGSSRIPLVATLIGEQLHVLPINLDQPETAVALGAHHVNEGNISLRTKNLPNDIPAHLAESRTVAVAPPRPQPAPPMPVAQHPQQGAWQQAPPPVAYPPGPLPVPPAALASGTNKTLAIAAGWVLLGSAAAWLAMLALLLANELGTAWDYDEIVAAAVSAVVITLAAIAGSKLVRARDGRVLGIIAGIVGSPVTGFLLFNAGLHFHAGPWLVAGAVSLAGLVFCLLPQVKLAVKQTAPPAHYARPY